MSNDNQNGPLETKKYKAYCGSCSSFIEGIDYEKLYSYEDSVSLFLPYPSKSPNISENKFRCLEGECEDSDLGRETEDNGKKVIQFENSSILLKTGPKAKPKSSLDPHQIRRRPVINETPIPASSIPVLINDETCLPHKIYQFGIGSNTKCSDITSSEFILENCQGETFLPSDFLRGKVEKDEKFWIRRRKNIELRSYQKELVEKSYKKNSIVLAPTGSGKTVVAAEICRRVREREGKEKKIVMVVDKVNLANQQAGALHRMGTWRVGKVTSNCNSNFVWDHSSMYDIIVFIAEKFARLLANDSDAIRILRDISLVVFDEVHHATRDHPYSKIRDKLFINPQHRPQILGMTASLSAGKTEEETKTKVQTFLNEFESRLVVVTENRKDLEEVSPTIMTKETAVEISDEDREKTEKLERKMKEYEDKIGLKLKDDVARYSKMYHETIANKKKDNEKAYVKLDEYYHTLRFFNACGHYADEKPEESDKIEELKNSLGDVLAKPDCRVIIFVTMKKAVRELYEYLTHAGDFDDFKFGMVMGQTKSGEIRGMTRNEQMETISQFRTGKIQVLISTSVLEEGFDVPNCDTVIYFGDITSERSLIQARGRARHAKSTFEVIYMRDSKGEQSYHKSKRDEEMMNKIYNWYIDFGQTMNQISNGYTDSGPKLNDPFSAVNQTKKATQAPSSSLGDEEALEKLRPTARLYLKQIAASKKKDFKSILKELVDKSKVPNPVYERKDIGTGNAVFLSSFTLAGIFASGQSSKSKEAEQFASRDFLQKLCNKINLGIELEEA